jgi:prolyl 4-hydroxylase
MVRFPTALSSKTTLVLLAVSVVALATLTAHADQALGHNALAQFANKDENPSQGQERETPTKTEVNLTKKESETTCNDDSEERQGKFLENPAMLVCLLQVTMQQSQEEDFGAEFGEVQTLNLITMPTDEMIKAEIMREFTERLQIMRKYMRETVFVDERYKNVKDNCRNQHESCVISALQGKCKEFPGYMSLNCAPACHTCEMLSIEKRCPPLDPNAVDVFAKPGDVNKLFTRIISDQFYQQFGPIKVLSRPDLTPGDSKTMFEYRVGGPWILLFENAMTAEEADRLIEFGNKLGYTRSYDAGERKADGTYSQNFNNGRSSTHAWCFTECANDPLVQRVLNRIVNMTGIPIENFEPLQLLQYEKDQFYQLHSDYLAHETERQAGVRVLTLFFYLSNVLEGGETYFANVGLKVQPKKGQLIMWPSVLDADPNQRDPRTDHTALPVIQGIKYGVNAWIHQRDFKTPHRFGC